MMRDQSDCAAAVLIQFSQQGEVEVLPMTSHTKRTIKTNSTISSYSNIVYDAREITNK